MRQWMLKAAIQGIISTLPSSTQLNYFFQKNVTGNLAATPQMLIKRIEWSQLHLSYYKKHAASPNEEPVVLELGTGWFPTVPIALSLCGCKKIYTVDIVPLIFEDYFRPLLSVFVEMDLSELKQFAPCIKESRFFEMKNLASQGELLSVDQILEKLGIVRIIGDARTLSLAEGEIDLIVSNTTLEHIPLEVLQGLYQEFYRISHKGTVNSHLIDMNDHYSYGDESITNYNFLRFSENQWRWFNNDLHYQNRLRLS